MIRHRVTILSGLGAAAVLVLCGCGPVPPIVYHEGRTAELSHGWPPEPAGGLNYWAWQYRDTVLKERTEQNVYVHGGAFTGQRLGRFAFEEGLIVSGRGLFMFGLAGGVGLHTPAIALHGSYYPLLVSGSGVQMNLLNGWWQASLLGGFRFASGAGQLSAGGITSPLGIGPTLVGECRYKELALRSQGSVTFRAPWASGRVTGRVITLGLSAARVPGP